MRFSVVVLFAASLVSAIPATKRNDDDFYPACGDKCFDYVLQTSFCVPDDIECFCASQTFSDQLLKCVTKDCGEEDAKKTKRVFINACDDVVGFDPRNPFPKCGGDCVKGTPSYCDDRKPGEERDRCYCKDGDWVFNVIECTKQNCQGDDLEKSRTVGEGRCRAAGIDISGNW